MCTSSTFPWSCTSSALLVMINCVDNAKTQAWHASLLGTGKTFDTCTYEFWFMSIQPCLMSHDDEQHETLTAPTSKHIVVNGHCEPGAQTRVWLSPTCCWIYLLGHSLARLWLSPTCFVFWGNALCCQCFQRSTLPREALIIPTKQSSLISHTGWKENVAWSGAPRLYLSHGWHVHVRF